MGISTPEREKKRWEIQPWYVLQKLIDIDDMALYPSQLEKKECDSVMVCEIYHQEKVTNVTLLLLGLYMTGICCLEHVELLRTCAHSSQDLPTKEITEKRVS